MPSWLLPLIAAPFVGSFMGVLIRRLPGGAPVAFARSACERCGHRLGLSELVPLASYLLQRGRCRACGAAIAPAHLAVEFAAVAVALWGVLASDDAALAWLSCGLGWTLLTLAWIDWEHLLLPDALTLPLLLAGLAATGWLDPAGLAENAAAATVAYLCFRAIELTYRRLRGRDGLGQGDSKLAAAAGAWVGLAGLSTVILVAAALGLATALLQCWLRGLPLRAATTVPFGPGLCAALWLVWLYG